MIRVAGHRKGNGSATYEEDADLPLYVSCCGYQNFLTKDFSIQRPTGRLDYQILYIHKGCGHFSLIMNGRRYLLEALSSIFHLNHRSILTMPKTHRKSTGSTFPAHRVWTICKDITFTTVTSDDIVR